MQAADCPHVGQQQKQGQGALHSWASSSLGSSLLETPFLATPAGPWLHAPPGSTLTDTLQPVKVYTLNMDQQWDSQGTRHVIQLHGVAEGMSLLVKA